MKPEKQQPRELPSRDSLQSAIRTISDWWLHFYQLLHFHTPPLANVNYYDPPFVVEVGDTSTAGIVGHLNIICRQSPQYNFALSPLDHTEDVDEATLRKCESVLEAIEANKQKPHPSACCGLAETTGCVCAYSCRCVLHGRRCVGSHD